MEDTAADRPRSPESTILYSVVAQNLETFLARQQERERPIPSFFEEEFRSYLKCGQLEFGFLRLYCDTCRKDRLLPFSCKGGRAFCPPCGGRRMADTAAHLVDLVIPAVPGALDAKALKFPEVGPDHAASIEILISSNEGPEIAFENAHVIGLWRFAGREESCLIVALRILWDEELRALADITRRRVAAQAEAAGLPKDAEHRYFIHGHDAHGVRFGIELAAI